MKAVFAARCTNEYGDSPSFFAVDVTAKLIKRIEQLLALCENGIIRITADCNEGQWGASGEEEKMRLFGDELVVSRYGFWFQTYVKHQDGHIETGSLGFNTLKADFAAGKEVAFYGDHSNELEITYTESLGETDGDES